MSDLSAAIAAAPTCVTLNAIREHDPCAEGWKKLLAHLGKTQADDEPLPLLTILESNGPDDAIWALRALSDADMPKARLFAVACARDVQHLMTDPRSIAALDVAERHAKGEATGDELSAARDAAQDAARAAWGAARDAARDAARAAQGAAQDAAQDAAWAAQDAAQDAAWGAAWVAQGAAQDAAWDAQGAAQDAARAAQGAAWDAWGAVRKKQRDHFIRIFGGSNG